MLEFYDWIETIDVRAQTEEHQAFVDEMSSYASTEDIRLLVEGTLLVNSLFSGEMGQEFKSRTISVNGSFTSPFYNQSISPLMYKDMLIQYIISFPKDIGSFVEDGCVVVEINVNLMHDKGVQEIVEIEAYLESVEKFKWAEGNGPKVKTLRLKFAKQSSKTQRIFIYMSRMITDLLISGFQIFWYVIDKNKYSVGFGFHENFEIQNKNIKDWLSVFNPGLNLGLSLSDVWEKVKRVVVQFKYHGKHFKDKHQENKDKTRVLK